MEFSWIHLFSSVIVLNNFTKQHPDAQYDKPDHNPQQHVEKREIVPQAPLVVLGGPAMLIGLGGGAASSMTSGSSHADLDFEEAVNKLKGRR